VSGNYELHVTGFISDELRWSPQRVFGGTAMGEWRKGNLALAASSRLAFGENDTNITGGGHAKYWLESTSILLMAEVDTTWQRFRRTGGESRMQLASYLGPVWFPTQGLSVSATYELYDEDLTVRNVERHGLGAWVSFMPRAHFEVMLSSRYQFIGKSDSAFTTLLQVHYFL
jgi:hypothetical protein